MVSSEVPYFSTKDLFVLKCGALKLDKSNSVQHYDTFF